MGNCVFKGFHHNMSEDMMVKVVTSNGGIMELFSPITVECITNEFPGHGIFRSRRDIFSEPLPKSEELHGGQVYYLLPLNPSSSRKSMTRQLSDVALTPYRMSTCDKSNNNNNNVYTEPEVVPRYNSSGVWKVKLVISPEKLSEILSQESRTEALIESVRTVAKCGNGVPSSVANSDQWSLASSWKGSMSEKMGVEQ
ncbi:uncharacterized protein LOC124839326 [Vigna umbellata]|uniref:DUF4228 domain-containing protein n=2 Tax=Phaseolus angularis TaxID=3914 RepID=A0A8T0JPH1_PHAAN|nr:uncharacterized protein LOC108347255 [Vigna angularis]XP_047171052.1 uncharacterized protein LOC124839326 [Vigna umbellata]KAG2380145.1 uncharacterized protein HKW66_Vig0169240 [Vigna angularis]BAT98168.1 hypothetical protein VIGAN_09179800 [Vigna angularis var. angularis]